MKKTEKNLAKEQRQNQKELDANIGRISDLDTIIGKLYEDYVFGKLKEDRFIKMSSDYEKEQAELKKRAELLSKKLKSAKDQTLNRNNIFRFVKNIITPKELNTKSISGM